MVIIFVLEATFLEITQVISYEGGNDTLVWKHPIEDFNTTTQLIVHESQEAILFKNGQALDLFPSGKYTLESQNIPLLQRVFNWATDGKTPFHCEVYFINKVDCMDVMWGTITPIPIQDPIYDIILPVRANGQFSIRIDDSRKFLVKIVGTTKGIGKETLNMYFRGLLMTRIKDYISNMMMTKKISFLEIHSYLNEASQNVHSQINSTFAEYGVKVVNFFVNSIFVPESDTGYIKIKNALAAAKERELLAKGKKAEMDIIGYTYQQERTFGVLDRAAQNEGAGSNLTGMAIGLGMGLPVGNMVGQAVGSALENVTQKITVEHQKTERACPKCNAKLPEIAKFCMECGEKVIANSIEEVICPSCNQKVPKERFCMNCGSRL